MSVTVLQRPYKKMKSAHREWIRYTQIRQLEKNKPYKVETFNATSHAQYGEGQQATLKSPLGNRLLVQLRQKYFSNDDLKTIKSDVVNGKIIFLVFREIMDDNSYRIDLTEASEEWIENYNKNQEVKELKDSLQDSSLDLLDNGEPANTEDASNNGEAIQNKSKI